MKYCPICNSALENAKLPTPHSDRDEWAKICINIDCDFIFTPNVTCSLHEYAL